MQRRRAKDDENGALLQTNGYASFLPRGTRSICAGVQKLLPDSSDNLNFIRVPTPRKGQRGSTTYVKPITEMSAKCGYLDAVLSGCQGNSLPNIPAHSRILRSSWRQEEGGAPGLSGRPSNLMPYNSHATAPPMWLAAVLLTTCSSQTAHSRSGCSSSSSR